MTVTKRTRFEVLRRDQHTCQYCGATAPGVTLQIDHVVPISLGGDDKPGNLVTSCADCNRGKASIQPDSPLVEGLSERAAAYALGMQDKMTRFRADFESADEFIEQFDEAWGSWNVVGKPNERIPLPPDYELSLFRWAQMGIPFRAIEMAIPKAMKKPSVRGEFGVFQYMAGIVWNLFESREIDRSVTDETAAVYTESEMHDIRVDAYEAGDQRGWSNAHQLMQSMGRLPSQDFVGAHIDKRTSIYIDNYREGGTPPWRENTRTSDSTSGTMTTSAF